VDIVGICGQATTGQDTAEREDLLCGVMKCRVHELDATL
jgi:hypothetical protein